MDDEVLLDANELLYHEVNSLGRVVGDDAVVVTRREAERRGAVPCTRCFGGVPAGFEKLTEITPGGVY